MIASCGILRLVAFDHREDERADQREAEAHPVDVRIVCGS